MYKHYKSGYFVSSNGKVKRLKKGKQVAVKIFVGKCGYKYFHIFHTGQNIFIHRAVAKLFLPPIKGKWIVDHIDRDKFNNKKENLRWVNHSENMLNREKWKKRERCDPVKMY